MLRLGRLVEKTCVGCTVHIKAYKRRCSSAELDVPQLDAAVQQCNIDLDFEVSSSATILFVTMEDNKLESSANCAG